MAVDTEVLEPEAMSGEESGVAGSTEAPEESAAIDPGEELGEVAPQTDDDGQPRDEHGRFATKSSQAEPQADGSTGPIAPVAPTDPNAAPPDTTQSEGQPFVFKSDKRDFTIEGARVFPGEGLYVPESEIARTQQLLSQGVYLEQNWRKQETTWQQRLADAEARAAPGDLVEREQRAEALLAELTAVLTDEDKMVEFVQNLNVNGPALMERARARELQDKLNKYQQQERQVTTEAQGQQEQQDKTAAFQETLDAMKGDPRFRVFTPEDWQEYAEEMAELESVLFVRKEDGLYLDQGRMVKAAERQARLLGKAQQIAMKQVQGVKKAVEFNAARTASRVQAPPPATTPSEPKERRRETLDEWKKRNGIFI